MSKLPIPAFTRQQRLMLFVLPPLVVAAIRLLCLTLRFHTIAAPGARPADRTPGPDLYPFWHDTLLLAAYRYRNLGIQILISQSFDGELISRIVQRLGFVPVRGSSSRGGITGFLALTHTLQHGGKAAITVDGPRGPRHQAKSGAATIALRAAIPSFSPFHLHPACAWTLRSWDRFLIPKPFTNVICTWPTPLLTIGTPTSLTTALQHALDIAAEAENRRTDDSDIPG